MPRPVPETRLRRFMMQFIMWIILGGTVGLAALLDHSKQRSLQFELGQPSTFEGFSIRLPAGWKRDDVMEDSNLAITLQDPGAPMAVIVEARPPIPFFRRPRRPIGERLRIPFGDVQTDVAIRPRVVDGEPDGTELSVMRALGTGRVLSITVVTASPANLARLGREIDILKQIAASARIGEQPTTEPQDTVNQ